MPELYSTTNLIINNIPSAISDEQLNKLFSTFGAIKSCKIIRSNDKESKAFGFCEYNDARSAKQALSQLDNYRLNDRILKVSYAKLFPKPKGKCIEVCNLPKSTQEDIVRKYFSQFGRIARLRLLLNGIGSTNENHFKTAEIVYENKTDAEKACLHNVIKWIHDNGKYATVTVNLTSPDRPRPLDRIESISMDTNNKSNVLFINSNHKAPNDHFYNFNNAGSIGAVQTPIDPGFNVNSTFDLSNLSNIMNCTSFTPIYHHGNAFQFANGLQAAAATGFYSQHFNNLAIQIAPQQQHYANHYDINESNKAIPVQYHHANHPQHYAAYPSYNSFIHQTANPLPLGIPLMYTALANNYPIKTVPFDKSLHQIYTSNHSCAPVSGHTNSNKSISPRSSYVVYVYNIGNSTTKEQLKELFAPKFGKEILKVDVPKDSQNGSNKNFGFVTFGNFQKAQMAIQEMNGKEFQGKPLQVSFKK